MQGLRHLLLIHDWFLEHSELSWQSGAAPADNNQGCTQGGKEGGKERHILLKFIEEEQMSG